ncbi:MAG: ROK family protein [Acidimicrobiales bacterium]
MLTAGVDVGGTKILAIAVDRATGRVAAEPVRAPTPKLDASALVEAVAVAVDGVEAALGRPVDAVGVGLPGLVDRSGTLAMGPHLPGIRNHSFADAFALRLGRPVTVDNDATCAVWAEHRLGAARGASDVVMVTLGTGIGAGIVAGGRLSRGANGFAGEPGHMVIDPDGPPCECGRRGCWEQYASGHGLIRLAGGRTSEEVIGAAREGDPEAGEVVRRFAWWFALGVANLVAVLDPQVVVVGGGLVEAGDVLFDPLRHAYRDLVMASDVRPAVPIVPAALGERANAVGAGLLAAETR